MKMFGPALAGALPAFVLLVCIQLNARAACMPPSPEMQSWFIGDDTVNHHIWHPVGMLYNGATSATAKVSDGFSLRQLFFADRRLPASNGTSLLAPSHLAKGAS